MAAPRPAPDAGRLAAWRVSQAPWPVHDCRRFLAAQHGLLARAWFQQRDVWALPATRPLLIAWVEDTVRALRQRRLAPSTYDACASALRRGAALGAWSPVASDPVGGVLLEAVARASDAHHPWTWRTHRAELWAADRLLRHAASPAALVLAIGHRLALDGPSPATGAPPRRRALTEDRVRRVRAALAHPQAPETLVDDWIVRLSVITRQDPLYVPAGAFAVRVLLPALCRWPATPARRAQGAALRRWLDAERIVPAPVEDWWSRALGATDPTVGLWWLTRTIAAAPAHLALVLPQLSPAQRRLLSPEGLALCCGAAHPGLREAALTTLVPAHRRPRPRTLVARTP